MITPENLQDVIQILRESHGSYAEAARVTGISPAYFSRVASGDLKPRDIRQDVKRKLTNGLNYAQRNQLQPQEKLAVRESHGLYSTEDPELKKIVEWLRELTPKQFDALKTLLGMMEE